MSKALVVIVNGSPGAGKTTLGRRLAKDLKLPFLSKDDIKECLFDTLGWSDRAWSQKLGGASIELLFLLLERQLEAGKSVVVEMPFVPVFHTPRLLNLARRYEFEPLQFCCVCDEVVLYERFQRRIDSGERHPGHAGQMCTLTEFKAGMIRERFLEIGGSSINVDTTDLKKVNYSALEGTVARTMRRLAATDA
jgi:predicted kinase